MLALWQAVTESVPFTSNPWVVAPTAIGVVAAFAFLVVKVLSIGTEASDRATKAANAIVEPLQREVERLQADVTQCRAESLTERLWHQILLGRLEAIIRENNLPIPPDVWTRP